MNKKLILASATATGILALAAVVPMAVFAADATTNPATTFVQKLAAQLGIDQTKVQTAVDSVKTDMQAERKAEFKTEVAQAVTDGKLTQRQADLLLAMQDIKPTGPMGAPTTDSSTLTEDQRKAQMETMRTQREQEIVDQLNTNGLNTTLDEVQAANTAAHSAGLRGGFGPGGRGPGGRGGERQMM